MLGMFVVVLLLAFELAVLQDENVIVTLSKTPSTDEIAPGLALTLTCAAKADPKPDYLLFKNTTNDIVEYNNAATAEVVVTDNGLSYTHTIASTALGDSTIYTCNANNTNTDGTENTDQKTSEVIIVKDVSVALTKNPAEEKVFKGESVSFICVAKGGRKPDELQFDKNETTILKYPNSSTGMDTSDVNTLTYTKTDIKNADYSDSATYKCSSKNKAAGNAVKEASDSQTLIVVKNATINAFTLSDSFIDYGQAVTFNFSVEGGAVPDLVKIFHSGSLIFDQYGDTDIDKCNGTNVKICVFSIGKVDYSHDGDYILKVENVAKAWTSVEVTRNVTIIKDVSVNITPASSTDIAFASSYTVTCVLGGGQTPHRVELNITKASGNETKLWKRDNSSSSLSCTGGHNVTCTYTFTPGYDSDGQYKCTGYNKVRSDEVRSAEKEITLTTVRASTVLSITPDKTSALVNETVTIVCTVAGKPQPANAAISWTHSGGYNMNSNYTTVATGSYDLTSTLALTHLVTELSGVFTCKVGSSQMSTVQISVAQSDSDVCKKDTYLLEDACEDCPEKSTSPGGSVGLEACLCNANTYLNNVTCESCPEGHHSDQGSLNVSKCLQDACQNDTYLSKDACKDCPANSTSPEGSVGLEACLCNANTYLNNGTCESCPENSTSLEGSVGLVACQCNANTYLNGDGCESCPENSTTSKGSVGLVACLCNANTYLNAGTCGSCPEGHHSDQGSLNDSMCLQESSSKTALIVIGTCLAPLVILLAIAVAVKAKSIGLIEGPDCLNRATHPLRHPTVEMGLVME